MSGPALLHNMSVPPISTVFVVSPGLPARTFRVEGLPGGDFFDPKDSPPAEELEALFGGLGLPDLAGVFTGAGQGAEPERTIGFPESLSILARRSGHLYLPWRAVYPPTNPGMALYLSFPEEGGEA